MQAVVVGAGKLGFEVARRLSEAGHDVVLIDQAEEALEEGAEHLDVMTLTGHGASPSVLRQAGIERAQLLVAATESDEVNIVTCLVAKRMGNPLCVARVRDPEYVGSNLAGLPGSPDLSGWGIDRVVRPEELAAKEILRMLRTPWAAEVEYFAGDRAAVVSFSVEPNAPAAGHALRDLRLEQTVVAGIIRASGEVVIPDGSTVIEPGDRIYFMGRVGSFAEARSLVGREAHPLRSLVIVGGGPLGFELARLLTAGRKPGLAIRLVERDRRKCRALAEKLPDSVMVLNANAADPDFLEEEALAQADACVLATGDDHRNLLVGMMLLERGIHTCISELSREEYVPLAHRLGISACVVPRVVTASFILQLIQRRNVRNLALIEEGKAEILELEVEPGSRAAGRSVETLGLPKSVVMGLIVRNGEVMIPRGSTRIHAGDQVLLFLRPDGIDGVQRVFRQA